MPNTTIITEGELIAAMPRITDEAYSMNITMAIADVERYIVKDYIGDANYIEFLDNPLGHDSELNGGIVVKDDKEYFIAGLKAAEYHLVYAYMLRETVYVSVYGVSHKKDDYSEAAGESELLKVAMFHNEMGLGYLRELCEYMGIKTDGKTHRGFWNEYV